ncbi:MAG: amidohydrolase family protein [Albidovulum sp.]|nr:amidohydrolase family protein [Albidovulum sp.]MDE0306545.1 amidohydrolase family protein [Albidovulum sp.]MDE0531195.1 amidohydrolase family protein [Albidovulum sp.]
MKKLIRNVTTIAAGGTNWNCCEANVLIDGSQIVAVEAGAEFGHEANCVEEIDGSELLAIPGLVNGHFHSSANLMKGQLNGLPLEIFMLHEVPPLSDTLQPDRMVYVRTMLGAIEMLKNGVTSVQDDAFFVPFPSPGNIDAVMSAYADSGIRATVALDQPNIVEYEKYPFLKDILTADELRRMETAPIPSSGELLALYGYLIDNWDCVHDGRIRAAVSCSAPHRVSDDYLAALYEISRNLRLPFYMHVLETKVQRVFGDLHLGSSLLQYVHERGVLDRRSNVIHGIWLDEADLSLVAEAGSVISHNPVCNLRLGSGIMPFRRIRELGIPVCIGTDEAIADDSINLWTAMKMAGLIHNITDPDYRKWPTAGEILSCVFQGGARAMGLEGQIGALAPGFQADIVLLDLNEIAFTPLNDVQRQLVYCENGSSVRMTMVDGKVLVRDGRVCSVDEESIKREAREYAHARAGELAKARATAAELEPYYREMYFRAAATDVGMNRWGHADSNKKG